MRGPYEKKTDRAESSEITPRDFDAPGKMETFSRFISFLVGIALVGAGIYFSVGVYAIVKSSLTDPEKAASLIGEWEEVLGKDVARIQIDQVSVSFSRIIAIGILGIGCIVLSSIALSILGTGVKVMLSISSDREAIRKMLRYTSDREPGSTRNLERLSRNIAKTLK